MGDLIYNKILLLGVLTGMLSLTTACNNSWKTEAPATNSNNGLGGGTTTTVMVTTTIFTTTTTIFSTTTTWAPTTTMASTTTLAPTTTMAPTTTVAPTTTTIYTGSGIYIPAGSPLAGYYPNLAALANAASNASFASCIMVNGCKMYNGWGPCYQVSAPGYNVSQDPLCQMTTTTTTLPPATTTTVPPATTTTVPVTTTTVAPGADLCAAFPDVQMIDVPLTYSRTIIGGYFGNDSVVVARFSIPAGYSASNAYIDATVAEWQGPPTYRWATISTRPCDFRALDETGQNGPLDVTGGTTSQNLVDIGPGKPNPQLLPGQTYYLNVRNAWVNEYGQVVGSCQESTNCKASIVIIDRQY